MYDHIIPTSLSSLIRTRTFDHSNSYNELWVIRRIQRNQAWICDLGNFKNHNHYQFSSMSSSKNQFLFQFIISFILTFDDFSLEKNNDKENLMMMTYHSINWHFRHNMSKDMGISMCSIKLFFERPWKVSHKKVTCDFFYF